jgi:hypothetical protein
MSYLAVALEGSLLLPLRGVKSAMSLAAIVFPRPSLLASPLNGFSKTVESGGVVHAPSDEEYLMGKCQLNMNFAGIR